MKPRNGPVGEEVDVRTLLVATIHRHFDPACSAVKFIEASAENAAERSVVLGDFVGRRN